MRCGRRPRRDLEKAAARGALSGSAAVVSPFPCRHAQLPLTQAPDIHALVKQQQQQKNKEKQRQDSSPVSVLGSWLS